MLLVGYLPSLMKLEASEEFQSSRASFLLKVHESPSRISANNYIPLDLAQYSTTTDGSALSLSLPPFIFHPHFPPPACSPSFDHERERRVMAFPADGSARPPARSFGDSCWFFSLVAAVLPGTNHSAAPSPRMPAKDWDEREGGGGQADGQHSRVASGTPPPARVASTSARWACVLRGEERSGEGYGDGR